MTVPAARGINRKGGCCLVQLRLIAGFSALGWILVSGSRRIAFRLAAFVPSAIALPIPSGRPYQHSVLCVSTSSVFLSMLFLPARCASATNSGIALSRIPVVTDMESELSSSYQVLIDLYDAAGRWPYNSYIQPRRRSAPKPSGVATKQGPERPANESVETGVVPILDKSAGADCDFMRFSGRNFNICQFKSKLSFGKSSLFQITISTPFYPSSHSLRQKSC